MSELLRDRPDGPTTLRALLRTAVDERRPLVLPGCHDALGARLIEQAGFEASYMTGFGTAAGLLGRPDVGLLGSAEMVENARRISDAIDLPLVADADTGYGNAINTIRTVQQFERAGVAGVHLEDQVLPKRCGHMEHKQVIDAAAMEAKVCAAIEARQNPDFVVIARTDARGPLGLDEALRRARRYRDAGADMIFVEALETEAEVERAADELAGTQLVFNWVDGGKTPPLTYDRIAELGYAAIIVPIGPLLAASTAVQRYLSGLREMGTPAELAGDMMQFGDFTDLIGLDEIAALEQRFPG